MSASSMPCGVFSCRWPCPRFFARQKHRAGRPSCVGKNARPNSSPFSCLRIPSFKMSGSFMTNDSPYSEKRISYFATTIPAGSFHILWMNVALLHIEYPARGLAAGFARGPSAYLRNPGYMLRSFRRVRKPLVRRRYFAVRARPPKNSVPRDLPTGLPD